MNDNKWARGRIENAIECTEPESQINDFAKQVHDNAVEHGWWEEERSIPEIIALCHSELSEALEEYRNGKPLAYFVDDVADKENINLAEWHGEKLEGIAVEMIDCIIRILDWCEHAGVDVEELLVKKHLYNIKRPYKHGGKVI